MAEELPEDWYDPTPPTTGTSVPATDGQEQWVPATLVPHNAPETPLAAATVEASSSPEEPATGTAPDETSDLEQTEVQEAIQPVEWLIDGKPPTHPITGEVLQPDEFFIQRLYPGGFTQLKSEDQNGKQGEMWSVILIFGKNDPNPMFALIKGDGDIDTRDDHEFTHVDPDTVNKKLHVSTGNPLGTTWDPVTHVWIMPTIGAGMTGGPVRGARAQMARNGDGDLTRYFKIEPGYIPEGIDREELLAISFGDFEGDVNFHLILSEELDNDNRDADAREFLTRYFIWLYGWPTEPQE